MAEETDRFKIPYPSRGATNYFDVYQSGMEAIDAAVFASFSERNTVVHGGGTITWSLVGSNYEFTFSDSISYQTPTFGQSQSAIGANVEVPPAHFVYADISRGSTSSSTSLVFVASTQVPVDNVSTVLAWHNPSTNELLFVTGLLLTLGGSTTTGIYPVSGGGGGGDTATPFVVDSTGATSYTTVQSGIDAAYTAYGTSSNDQVVIVRPGTYAENLTIKPGVAVVGLSEYVPVTPPSSSLPSPAPSTIIVGEHIVDETLGAISSSFSNVEFQSPTVGHLPAPTIIQYGTGAGAILSGTISFHNCLFDQTFASGFDEKVFLTDAVTTASAEHTIIFASCRFNIVSQTAIDNIDIASGNNVALFLKDCFLQQAGGFHNAFIKTSGANSSIVCNGVFAQNLSFKLDNTGAGIGSLAIERSEIEAGYGDDGVYSADAQNPVSVDDSCVEVDGADYVFSTAMKLNLGLASFRGFTIDVYDPVAVNFVYDHPKLHRGAHQGATQYINVAGPTDINTHVVAVDVATNSVGGSITIEMPAAESLEGAFIVVRDADGVANSHNIIVNGALNSATGTGSTDTISKSRQVITYVSMDVSGGLGTTWRWVRCGAIK
jgi:hypothetical protein